ncbi:MAG TPA: pilus assembly protein TadG-related protein [Longimicrobiales bacterium]
MAFLAVCLVALIAVLGLVIDLGRAFTARGEAQRAADAAALAGASAFLEFDPAEAVEPARERALDFATRNLIRNDSIDPGEVTVQVLPDEEKVRVTVRRAGLATWFARIFGVETMAVSAQAAAVAASTGSAKCVKPFTIPDLWEDADNDVNGNRIWDEDEIWSYDPASGDRYQRFDTDASGETGFGSSFRDGSPDSRGYTYDNDYGRRVVLKHTDPQNSGIASFFQPWVIPGSNPGASDYRTNIATCNPLVIDLGTEYEVDNKTGDMVGPTIQGMEDLIAQDPDAYWDETTNSVQGSKYANWLDSPRVIIVPLYDPAAITDPGKTTITFNNFALFFIEEQATRRDPVTGRFLYYTEGVGGNAPGSGSLVKFLRLVE